MNGRVSDQHDPIAIVGFAFRLPGGVDNPERLWQLLSHGEQEWTDVPQDRYRWQSFHHPDPDARGTHNARGGFFLSNDIAAFDAKFFGLPDAEASAIDPQQRLLLEVSYEALENAGMPVEGLRGSQTAVYVALVSRDYDRQIYKDPSHIPKYHLTGCGDATACGRISYTFDFKGPSMSIDTGCSGGLVGIHLACQALRLGESDMALVGGTNLLLGPDMTMAMSNLHMVNENGRCYPFDSRGEGYGRAEGVVVMVLKRLSDAERNGDTVRAIIQGSAVGQDGKTNGILLPSSEAQKALAAALYEKNHLDPQKTTYVEMHGTGTAAGDAAEIASIRDVFVGDGSRRTERLNVGSIKANLGHSESTSGLSGILSAVLAMEQGVIPPVAALQDLKTEVQNAVADGSINIPRQAIPWPLEDIRQASVNSFGFGGTNAHVILQNRIANDNGRTINGHCATLGSHLRQNGVPGENPGNSDDGFLRNGTALPEPKATAASRSNDHRLFCFSARSKASLEAMAEKYSKWVEERDLNAQDLSRLSQTLATRRSQFRWRASVIARNKIELLAGFQRLHITRSASASRPIFLFTGQGAQYATMGRELLQSKSVFTSSIQKSEAILTSLGASWLLSEELQKHAAESRINSSHLSQPATTAVQIAIVDHLRNAEVLPAAVLGHSSGEVAAAYAAGALTHEDALTISYHKGFVADWCRESVANKGTMLAVGLGEDEVARYLRLLTVGKASVACVNSPSSVTISGDLDAVAQLQKILEHDSVFNRLLKVEIAYHSHHMQAVASRFQEKIQKVNARQVRDGVRFFSSVTGHEHSQLLDPVYWVQNLTSKVRFSNALNSILSDVERKSSRTLMVEIGPHSALEGPIRQIVKGQPGASYAQYLPSLVRKDDSAFSLVQLLGQLWGHGAHLDLRGSGALGSFPKSGTEAWKGLPSYAWDHSQRHWHESRLSREYRFRQHAPHDLLGLRLTGSTPLEPVFRLILSVNDLPWLQEHIIDGFTLYPGSAFLVHAIEGLKQTVHDRGEKKPIKRYHFKHVKFTKSIVVPDAPGHVEVLISLKPCRTDAPSLSICWQEFRITSAASHNDGWNDNCHGYIGYELEVTASPLSLVEDGTTAFADIHRLESLCNTKVTSEQLYTDLRINGVDYGPNFAVIKAIHLCDERAIGTVEIPNIAQTMPATHMQPHVIHPATYDAFMHIALPLYHRSCSRGPVMLTSIGEASISADILNRPGTTFKVICNLTTKSQKSGVVEVSILQGDGQGGMIEVGSLRDEKFTSIGESVAQEYATKSTATIGCHLIQSPSNLSVQGESDQKRDIIRKLQQYKPLSKWLNAVSSIKPEDEIGLFHGDKHLNLEFKVTGLLETWHFTSGESLNRALGPKEVEVRVFAYAVNHGDVSAALGMNESTPGEFSGEVFRAGSQSQYAIGDRVFGWGATAVSNITRVSKDALYPVGKSMSYEAAASMPLAFTTAYQGLVNVGRLEEGRRVLVHNGASAIGQAAIAVSKAHGADVFATVEDENDLDILVSHHGLTTDRVFSLRTSLFQKMIKDVDIVMNCSNELPSNASIPCLADFGVIIQAAGEGQSQFESPNRTNVAIVSVDMLSLRSMRPQWSFKIFAEAMAFCEKAQVEPPTHTVMPIDQLEKSYRLVKTGRHTGTIVLRSDPDSQVLQSAPLVIPREFGLDDLYGVNCDNPDLGEALCYAMNRRMGLAHLQESVASLNKQDTLITKSHWIILDELTSEEITSKVRGIVTLTVPHSEAWLEHYATTPAQQTISKIRSNNNLEFDVNILQEKSVADAAISAAKSNTHVNGNKDHLNDDLYAVTTVHVPMLDVSLGLDHFAESKLVRELLATIEHCITADALVGTSSELFLIVKTDASLDDSTPVFEDLQQLIPRELNNDQPNKTIESQVRNEETLEAAVQHITHVLRQQLSVFCAIDGEDIRVDENIAAVGLDSLLAIEFKNWVVRTFKTPMQTTEILDSPSITALATLIGERARASHNQSRTQDRIPNGTRNGHQAEPDLTNGYDHNADKEELPPLPLPKLDTLVENHLAGVRPFASDEEFKRTLGLAEAFRAEGGPGSRLYASMEAAKADNPENWYSDLFMNNQYLGRKGALAPYQLFFFTHPPSTKEHSQSERAALVAAVLIKYKRALDSQQVKPRYLNEQPLCMDLYSNLFNAYREPRSGLDGFIKYDSKDYFVVLHRGHAYKVDFAALKGSHMHGILESTLARVLETTPSHIDWLGVLSADHRVTWTQNYEAFKGVSLENIQYLQAMQECAFVLCLDDASPETAAQRAKQVHFGDGSNRWVDKPINYVICANGVSGMVADHTGLDAPSVAEINQNIAAAIISHDLATVKRASLHLPLISLQHTGFPDIQSSIELVRTNYQAIIAKREHFFTSLSFGATYMKKYKIPPNSGFQLIVQLASRLYFGYLPACWETVLQMTYKKGRVEINQVITVELAEFIKAAADDSTSLSDSRRRFFEAARKHSSNILAATRSGGSDRFLSLLREISKDGEQDPELYSDPPYKRSRPRKIMSSCFKTHMAENGCVVREDDSIWLHFEVDDQSVKFSASGLTGQTDRFVKELQRAAERVRAIIEYEGT